MNLFFESWRMCTLKKRIRYLNLYQILFISKSVAIDNKDWLTAIKYMHRWRRKANYIEQKLMRNETAIKIVTILHPPQHTHTRVLDLNVNLFERIRFRQIVKVPKPLVKKEWSVRKNWYIAVQTTNDVFKHLKSKIFIHVLTGCCIDKLQSMHLTNPSCLKGWDSKQLRIQGLCCDPKPPKIVIIGY